MIFRFYITIIILFMGLVFVSYSQVSLPDTIIAFRIKQDINLDGILDEPCWSQAQKISNFTQRELFEGQPATERTEVAIVYTKNKLFIGVWCWDSEPDQLTAKEMKRDFDYWKEDNFEIIFDPFLNKRDGLIFVINPNGARADVQVSHQGEQFNRDWNGIWDAAVQVNEFGWFAEIEIPFSTFKFPNIEEHIWGINFERNIRRKREAVFWQGWSRDYNFEQVNHAGTLKGLKNIEGKENIELKPYGIAGKEFSNNKTVSNVGLDVNYSIVPTLKLNLTVNTDFAQVESDRAQINLSRFSLYYPEKRDFFLEGRDFFNFSGTTIFYSRNIGIQDERQIPILGGARLTGTLGNTNIGFITMQTAEKDTIPSTNFTVARVKQNVLENSSIGMIVTSKNNNGHYNYTYGLDATYVKDDFLGNKNLYIGALFAQSQTKDMDNVRNLGYSFYIDYPNDLIDTYTEFSSIQRDFNPELGFIQRKNFKLIRSKFVYMPRPESIDFIQKFIFKPYNFHIYLSDDNNKFESMDFGIGLLGFTMESGDNFEFELKRNFDRIDEAFTMLDEIEVKPNDYWWTTYSLEFNSFGGRKLAGGFGFNSGQFYNGDKKSIYSYLNYSVNRHLKLSFDYSNHKLTFSNNHYETNEFVTRIEYAFNPKATSSIFGQWNNEENKILINYRFHWIPVIGSDFYIVVNQILSTENNKLRNTDFTILSKLVWRFGF